MFLRILKTVFFFVVVLLVGQVRIGKRVIADHLVDALTSGGVKVLQSPKLAGFGVVKSATQWLHSGPKVDREKSESDEFSSADRESIIRLLPN